MIRKLVMVDEAVMVKEVVTMAERVGDVVVTRDELQERLVLQQREELRISEIKTVRVTPRGQKRRSEGLESPCKRRRKFIQTPPCFSNFMGYF